MARLAAVAWVIAPRLDELWEEQRVLHPLVRAGGLTPRAGGRLAACEPSVDFRSRSRSWLA